MLRALKVVVESDTHTNKHKHTHTTTDVWTNQSG